MAKSLRERYSAREIDRTPYLHRAQEAAKLTLPSLIPEDGSNGSTTFRTPYQGLGARGVNNLASKLVLALLPAQASFFKLGVGELVYAALEQQHSLDRTEVDAILGQTERATKQHIETSGSRSTTFETVKHLIVGGNALTNIDADGKLHMYGLPKYTVLRDRAGNVLEMILKETMARESLEPEVREQIPTPEGDDDPEKTDVDVYTGIIHEGDRQFVYVEIEDVRIKGLDAEYPLSSPAWSALRWTSPEGEHYGRGLVEEVFGDLKSYEGFSKALLKAASAAAKVIYGTRKGTGTLKRRLAKAESGDVLDFEDGDVTVLGLDKFQDFRVALEKSDDLARRLSQAFLLNSSVQRDAERVTAEEIRYLAAELEDALGGVYSVLGEEMQRPWAKRWMSVLTTKGAIPTFPDGTVEPMITTGLDALGRNRELSKMDVLIQRLSPLGPEVLETYLDIEGYIAKVANSVGVETDGLIRSEEQVRQIREQRAASTAAPGVMQELIKQAGGATSG